MKKTLIISTFLISGFMASSLFLTFASQPLMDKPVLTIMDKSVLTISDTYSDTTIIHPQYIDGTSAIIIYIKNDDGSYYVGSANIINDSYIPPITFLGLFSPSPDPTSHLNGTINGIMMEYKIENNLDCSILTPDQCQANPDFVSQFDFEVVGDNAVIPVPTLVNILSGATATSTIATSTVPIIQEPEPNQ